MFLSRDWKCINFNTVFSNKLGQYRQYIFSWKGPKRKSISTDYWYCVGFNVMKDKCLKWWALDSHKKNSGYENTCYKHDAVSTDEKQKDTDQRKQSNREGSQYKQARLLTSLLVIHMLVWICILYLLLPAAASLRYQEAEECLTVGSLCFVKVSSQIKFSSVEGGYYISKSEIKFSSTMFLS